MPGCPKQPPAPGIPGLIIPPPGMPGLIIPGIICPGIICPGIMPGLGKQPGPPGVGIIGGKPGLPRKAGLMQPPPLPGKQPMPIGMGGELIIPLPGQQPDCIWPHPPTGAGPGALASTAPPLPRPSALPPLSTLPGCICVAVGGALPIGLRFRPCGFPSGALISSKVT